MNRYFLAGLLIISSLQIARAEDTAQTAATPEQAVVELRITRRELVVTADTHYRTRTQDLGQGVCSGSFIDNNGDILTAGHCARNAIEIDVITYDQQHYEAVIVATSSLHDLALLHIDRRNTAHFDPAPSVTRGEQIFILGSPLAITNTLTTGIIAKIDGDVTYVDCGALPGNSGSAVYNTKGEMVGVLTAGFIVGMGTTHLNVIQSIDAAWFFVTRALHGIPQ